MKNCNFCGEDIVMRNVVYEATVVVKDMGKSTRHIFKYCKESCRENDAEYRDSIKNKKDDVE